MTFASEELAVHALAQECWFSNRSRALFRNCLRHVPVVLGMCESSRDANSVFACRYHSDIAIQVLQAGIAAAAATIHR